VINVKDIWIEPISAKIAIPFVKKYHYSHKVAATSLINFGAFLGKRLIGVAQFGRPINKYLHIKIVEGTKWNEFLEINRIVCIDDTPKNTESRFIAICIKLIKKNAPQIKWIMSYADACSCGDGTIYRASGFVLISINESSQLYKLNNGEKLHLMSLQGGHYSSKRKQMLKDGYTNPKKYIKEILGGVALKGKQLKYIYMIDKNMKLNVPILPFSMIDKMGAGMYKGQKRPVGVKETRPTIQLEDGGATPTTGLSNQLNQD
jgi:hypothetical protein